MSLYLPCCLVCLLCVLCLSIRDFMNEYNVLSDTFESSIEWDKIEDIVNAQFVSIRL